ncbi:head GIN domain-containing protein [soil metagenome]
MIRNLTIVAVASFVLALGCFGGAAAIGGRELMTHGWNIPMKDWHVDVSDDDDHVSIRSGAAEDGEDATRQIAWAGGDTLQIDVPAEVKFTQAAPGAAASITVSGAKRLVDRVTVENGRIGLKDAADEESSTLRINGRVVHLSGDDSRLSIEITAPAVKSFTLNGSGDLYVKGYDQPDLTLEVNGSGNVEAEGKTKKVDLQVSGSGSAHLRELETGDARIAVSGSGEAYVAPTGATDVDLAGSGDVYLSRKPSALSSNVAGSGEVHQDW